RRRASHPALRRAHAEPGDAGAQPVGREPAEARARARVPVRAAGARRRPADARPRRGRDRDGARVPAGGGPGGHGDPAPERGPGRDQGARGPDPGRLRGRGRRRARWRDGRRGGDRLPDGRGSPRLDGGRLVRLERRLEQPWWLTIAVPVGSLAVAFAILAVVLAATGHNPWHTYRLLVPAGLTRHPG